MSASIDRNYHTINGETAFVESDGLDDEDETPYPIVIHEPSNSFQDFTNGHVTPLALGAPPNSWAYEEFTIPNMVDNPWGEYDGVPIIKHGWFPIRERWHVPFRDLVFETEQACRFVRRITDAGAAITFATTTDGFADVVHADFQPKMIAPTTVV